MQAALCVHAVVSTADWRLCSVGMCEALGDSAYTDDLVVIPQGIRAGQQLLLTPDSPKIKHIYITHNIYYLHITRLYTIFLLSIVCLSVCDVNNRCGTVYVYLCSRDIVSNQCS